MSIQVKRRREAASFLATFTGAAAELIVDTTNNRVQVHDGVTPGGWPAAKLSEVLTNSRTAISDAAYGALASDRLIAFTALTASRTVTLCAASAYPTGTSLLILDETGSCSSSHTITLNRAGSDTINGAASATINVPYGYLALESNGSNAWTIVDCAIGSTGPAALATVAQAANGSNIQFGVLETLVALSGASTTAPIGIPANCIVFSVAARVVAAVVGAPSYGVGVSGSPTQFGGSLGTAAGSTNFGLIGPEPFYSATPLVITATSGSFTGGQVRLAIHYMLMGAPTS